MSKLSLETLNETAVPGGPSALAEISELAPAAGEQALISPAKYLSGKNATYVFETRFVEGEAKKTVLIDSRTSTANRLEDALEQAIDDNNPVLSKMPKIRVTYQTESGDIQETDLQLPHRAFDAHIRLGTIGGDPITKNEQYRAARNSSQKDAWNLFELSPITLLLGGWDSTRKSNQVRIPSAVVGEIIGVLADQDEEDPSKLVTMRSGARVDPVAAHITFSPDAAHEIADKLNDDLNPKKLKELKKATKEVAGSDLVIGAIPPTTDAIDGIATRSIIRSYVLSFATLRRLHFGKGPQGDASLRVLLAAIGIDAIVRNDSELFLRANTHLVEKKQPEIRLDRRMGEVETFEACTVDEADRLLSDAYNQAVERAGIDWNGQVLEVSGDPAVIQGASDDEEE